MNFFKVPAKVIRLGFNCWPPFWFTGIYFEHIAEDFRSMQVSMALRFYNKNLHGLHFGGNLYAMIDPCYLSMILRNLGRDYRVLDKSAYVDYIKPGKGKVTATMMLTEEDLHEIKQQTQHGDKYLKTFLIDIKNETNDIIARVEKTLYIRKKRR